MSSDKTGPTKVAEWNNPPAGFHNQDLHVDCDWENAPVIYAFQEECHLFLYGADPYPEMVEGAVQAPSTRARRCSMFHLGPNLQALGRQRRGPEPAAKSFDGGAATSPEPGDQAVRGGSLFNHDNVFHIHPITGQALLYISYWDAGLRIVDVSNPPPVPDPEGISWPQDNEVGRWLGRPSADDGWYGPNGGGHANMTPGRVGQGSHRGSQRQQAG